MKRTERGHDGVAQQQELWLGYAGLLVPFDMISAVLVYQPLWDRRILQHHGTVPSNIRSVVLLRDGRVLPSSRALRDLHTRWVSWEQSQRVTVQPDQHSGDSAE